MEEEKSKLQELMSSDDTIPFEPTVEDCREWFTILNEEIFDNKLTAIDEIDIRWRRNDSHAYYAYRHRKTFLLMNKRYRSKKFFIWILAHELVHHYQFLYHGKRVNHGPTFIRWSPIFKQKGIKLARVYAHEEFKNQKIR